MALLIFLSLDKFVLLRQPLFFCSFVFLVFEAEQFIINHLIGLFPAQTHLL